MAKRPRTKRTAQAWEVRRRQLFGWFEGTPEGSRQWVADHFGLSLRTVERYETQGAPEWYELALRGLALWTQLQWELKREELKAARKKAPR